VGVRAAISVRRALAVFAAAVITAFGSLVGSVVASGAGDLHAVRMTASASTRTNIFFLITLTPPVKHSDKYTLLTGSVRFHHQPAEKLEFGGYFRVVGK
jgi:hypothetical protein